MTRKRKKSSEHKESSDPKDELELKQLQLEEKIAELEKNKLKLGLKDEEMKKLELMLRKKEEELDKREEEMFKKDKCMFILNKKEDYLNNLERDLVVKKKLLDKMREEMKEKEADVVKIKTLAQKVTEKLACPVCMETPRHGPVPACPNGHFVCSKCKADSCPTCRTPMGEGKSLLALIVLENIDHSCKFENCDKKFPFEDIENHESVCSHRLVSCPQPSCRVKVSLPKLVDHCLGPTDCCAQKKNPLAALDTWNSSNMRCKDIQKKENLELLRMSWIMNIYSYSGEIFAVLPKVVKGQFYFVVLMFASEMECFKYKFEIVIHEREKDIENSEMIVRLEGCPLSIDITKEEMNLYGTSSQFMKKLMCKSSENAFTLSFKIYKK